MHLGWYMARPTVENIGNFSDMKKKILLPSLGFEPRTSRLLLYPVKERLQVRIPPGAKRFFRS